MKLSSVIPADKNIDNRNVDIRQVSTRKLEDYETVGKICNHCIH